MKCSALACETPASVRGYCAKDYLRRRRHGHYGRVDGTPAREHIAKLRALGWTYRQIDEAAGTKVSSYVARGKTQNVLPETAAKILTVALAPRTSRFPAVGFRRRVEALSYMGWPREEIAALSGLCVRLVNLSPNRATVKAEVFAKMRDVYARYNTVEGPSRLAAQRARTAGYQPPIAWDYTDIDDPKAKPFQGFKEAA